MKTNKLLSILLVIAMIFSFAQITSYAAESDGVETDVHKHSFEDADACSCGAVKADYSGYDAAITRYNELVDEYADVLIDETKEYIRTEIQELVDEHLGGTGVKDNYTEDEQYILDGIADGVNEICDTVEAGIADGTLVKADGLALLSELSAELSNEIVQKYDRETLMNFTPGQAAIQRTAEIEAFARSIVGTVAENKENLAKLEADIREWYDDSESCLNGEHNLETYTSNNDATCNADGTRTGVCVFCTAGEVTVKDPGSQLEHIDNDGDRLCDHGCGTEMKTPADDCTHLCHSDNWFMSFIWTVANFIHSVLGLCSVCVCGEAHY